jgi:hypothetical protein
LAWRLSARALASLGLLLVTVAVILTVTEFVVRYVYSDVTTTSDNRSYFARRWRQTRVRLNRLGFRERELDPEKSTAVYRIAVIGDSFTYGQGIGEKDRFSNLLDAQLNRQPGAYEVLNFGRPGAETVDHLKILTDVVLPGRPDFVLLQWYVNDVEGMDKSGSPRPRPLLPWPTLVSRLRRTSALFYLVDNQWVTVQAALGWMGSYEVYMRERFGDPHSPASIAAQEALRQFLSICKRRAVPVGMVLFSDSYGQRSPLDFLVDRALTLCAHEGIVCVDTRRTFAPFQDVTRLWANRLDPHPGPLAHRLVADHLLEIFGEVWRRRRDDSLPHVDLAHRPKRSTRR